MSDERKIRFAGKELGVFKFDALYRARMRGDFDHTAEFFSKRKNLWMPLAGILDDMETSVSTEERIQQLKQVGITKAEFLSTQNAGECSLCAALAGKIYFIDEIPAVPPAGCTCEPWCGLTLVAIADEG